MAEEEAPRRRRHVRMRRSPARRRSRIAAMVAMALLVVIGIGLVWLFAEAWDSTAGAVGRRGTVTRE